MLKNHLDIKERINYEKHKFYLYKSADLLLLFKLYHYLLLDDFMTE